MIFMVFMKKSDNYFYVRAINKEIANHMIPGNV